LTGPTSPVYKPGVVALAVAAVVVAYFAGSIPFGVLFARARGVDLRAVGSGNIGATNVARALGKRLGLLVFLCDAAKGFGPVLGARELFEGRMAASAPVVAAVGVAAFLGHLTSPFLRGRGGKGVATGFGVFLALSPWAALVGGALFLAAYAVTRTSSLGSLLGATAVVPALYLLGADVSWVAAAGLMWALIVFKHRGNIRRLVKREEYRV
jgi:acyl phosphate:glycerol-3-phosphate acyltransferase